MGMRDIPVPEIGPDDVLVQMKAAGVCGSDLHAYIGKHIFRFPPVMLGHVVLEWLWVASLETSGPIPCLRGRETLSLRTGA